MVYYLQSERATLASRAAFNQFGRKLKPVVFLMVGERAFDVNNDIWEVDHSELIGKHIEKDGFLSGALALMVHEPISPNKIKLIHKSRKRRNNNAGPE